MTPATSFDSGLAGSVQNLQRDREILDRMVADQSLTSDFQPVVELATGEVAGYKAIAHGPEGTAVATPVGLLESAKATGHLERLDWMFRCRAFELAMDGGVTKPKRVHITVESETYGSSCPPRLAAAFGRARRELLVAVDVPVRAYDDAEGLARGLDETRQIGWLVSLDDIAERPDAIEALDAIQPDVIKLDLARPGRVAGPGQLPGVTSLLAYAARTGTAIMAESVDLAVHRGVAEALGATYARGRVFGSPGPLAQG
ncbi:MAG TPA: EAL domain-containing protein [Mycobacteriales bacterium]|nr:EAL domain-containing protein [Mycobacteriales bacterium]